MYYLKTITNKLPIRGLRPLTLNKTSHNKMSRMPDKTKNMIFDAAHLGCQENNKYQCGLFGRFSLIEPD